MNGFVDHYVAEGWTPQPELPPHSLILPVRPFMEGK